jgi:hypothetical protein
MPLWPAAHRFVIEAVNIDLEGACVAYRQHL